MPDKDSAGLAKVRDSADSLEFPRWD